jgi:hypothetical protein
MRGRAGVLPAGDTDTAPLPQLLQRRPSGVSFLDRARDA